MAPPDDRLPPCGRIVRRQDRDRYLTVLTAPADRRDDLFAIHAFAAELARVPMAVSEPLLGLMRLQWWRDVVEGLASGPVPRHEVAEPLAAAVRRRSLDPAGLLRLVEARERAFEEEEEGGPATLTALEAEGEAAETPVLDLALAVLDASGGQGRAAAGHLAAAWALAAMLRAIPAHARRRRPTLPRDLVEAEGVDLGALLELRGHPALARAVEAIAARARARLAAARALRREVPARALPVLIGAVLVDLRLAVLARARHDVFDPRVAMPHPLAEARLVVNTLLGRY